MKIQLPNQAAFIIQTLEENGYEGFAVGGCVRDALLSRIPDDWDITTSAKPEQVKALFKRTIDTGIQHGTVTVLIESEGYEVTTYRIDGEYEDSRHPKEVSFTADLIEDLRRRDFTINAMAYNEKKGLVDAFDGAGDLERKVIRCVGDAKERFTEDALRILRAVRFSAQLGFEIEEATLCAIKELAPSLKLISAERIQTELVKLLNSSNPAALKTAWVTGITAVILPEFDAMMATEQNTPHHDRTVGEHTLKTLENTSPDKVLRLTLLCHDFGKPLSKTTDVKGRDHFYGHAEQSSRMSKALLRRLKFDNETINQVSRLTLYHDISPDANEKSVRKAIYKVGEDLFEKLLQVQRADIQGQSAYKQQEKIAKLDEIEKLYRTILEKKQCLTLKQLAISGSDLIEAGMKPGKELGIALNQLLQEVLDNPDHNTKEYLLKYSKTLI